MAIATCPIANDPIASEAAAGVVVVPTAMFEINHDGGDLGEYTTIVDADGDLSVLGSAAMASTPFGLQLRIDDTDTFSAQRTFTESGGTLNVRFYFDPNSATLDTANQSNWFRLVDALGPRAYWYLRKDATGDYEYFWLIQDDVGGFPAVPADWTPVTDGPHYFEIEFIKGNGTNGRVRVYQDGNLQGELTGRDIDGISMTQLLVGMISTPPGSTGDFVYFDQIAVSNFGYIGGEIVANLDNEQVFSSAYNAGLNALNARYVGAFAGGPTYKDAEQMIASAFNINTGKIRVVR